MPKLLKSAALALGVSVLAGGALAAEQMACCCKDKDAKMSCCDKMKEGSAKPEAGKAQPKPPAQDEHKH